MSLFCRNPRAMDSYSMLRLGGSPHIKQLIINGDINDLDSLSHHIIAQMKTKFFTPPLNGILGLKELNGWSPIVIPDKETLVTDSGKIEGFG